MNIEQYPFSTNEDYLDFEFFSEGPKGKIKKFVRYSPQNVNGITYFNLSFGDWDENKRQVDDLAVTNNQDRNKVLATVAMTVMSFTEHFPDVIVYATGSTKSRTRLYQMSIGMYWDEIEPLLYVYGSINGHWQPFRKKVNYEAFLIKRR